MTVSKDIVLKVAKLSRLRIDDQAAETFVPRLEKVIDWVQQLQDVDVTGIEPLANPMEDRVEETVWREDVVVSGDQAADILSNAPKKAHDMFQVPKVVE